MSSSIRLTDLMCSISRIANLFISRDMDRRAQVEERRKELERTEQERKEAILAKNKVSWILALALVRTYEWTK